MLSCCPAILPVCKNAILSLVLWQLINFQLVNLSVVDLSGRSSRPTSLKMILCHSVWHNIVKTHQSKRYRNFKGFKYIQHGSVFVPPFEILDVSSKTCQFICIPLRFSPEILRIKANSYCINCLKTFMKRKAKSMLHLVQLAMRLIARLISADAWKLKLVHVCRWEDNQAAIATSSQLWWDVCYPGIKC